MGCCPGPGDVAQHPRVLHKPGSAPALQPRFGGRMGPRALCGCWCRAPRGWDVPAELASQQEGCCLATSRAENRALVTSRALGARCPPAGAPCGLLGQAAATERRSQRPVPCCPLSSGDLLPRAEVATGLAGTVKAGPGLAMSQHRQQPGMGLRRAAGVPMGGSGLPTPCPRRAVNGVAQLRSHPSRHRSCSPLHLPVPCRMGN